MIQAGSGINAINAAVNLGGNQSWTNNSGNGHLLTVAGNVNNEGFRLTISGSDGTTLSGVLSGSGGLTVSGTGKVTIGGLSANTYTGETTVSSGELDLNTSAGTVAIQGAGTETSAALTS